MAADISRFPADSLPARATLAVVFRQGGGTRTVSGFRAMAGYDLASGLGTVNAARLVPELISEASR